ncbi:MAG: hypothetical protein EBQ58_07530 [Betaproteobacteria bacterium]|nr:hypothetical protein [Betaproteobacteria bacterium]
MGLVGCSGLSPLNQLAASKPLPPVKEVKSMLWVGNSFFYYNNSMHGHVGQLLNAAGQKGHRSSSATISGSGINWHDMEAHFKPNAVGSYSFVGDNEVKFNTFDRPFDATLVMDCSQCPIHPKLQSIFYEYAKKHSETLRKHGSEPILFMSWAYSDVPAMTEQLAVEYIKAGQQNNALVVPAGYAFANSVAKRPDLSLIIADKRHPTLAGTYLAACTVLASVYKINPIGSKYAAGLSPEVATHLQTVAWETSQAFHAKHGRGSLN